jgi:hypothetical protein
LWALDAVAEGACGGGACQAGGPPRAHRGVEAARGGPQTAAVGQPEAIAILIRHMLTLTSAPILSS